MGSQYGYIPDAYLNSVIFDSNNGIYGSGLSIIYDNLITYGTNCNMINTIFVNNIVKKYGHGGGVYLKIIFIQIDQYQ